jgi:hypothetical protein
MGATIVRERFQEECEYLEKYLDLVQRKISINESDIEFVSYLLNKNGVKNKLKTNSKVKLNCPLKKSDLESVLKQFQSIKEPIKNRIAKIEKDIIEIIRSMDDGYDADDEGFIYSFEDYMDDYLEGVDFWDSSHNELVSDMMSLLEDGQSREKIKSVRQTTIQQYKQISDTEENHRSIEDKIEFAIKDALIILYQIKIAQIEQACEKSEEIEIAVRMQSPKTEINILKQGFILLMTLFDATIFDLMRIAINKDFFGLIGILGEKDKIFFREFTDYSSFDEFRDEVVEMQLKKKYLKDIFGLLRKQGVEYVVDSSGFSSIHLTEMIQRRNIHIHNRGLVDEKYLERGKNGAPRYNIYNFALGDVAEIDNTYWEMATRLTKDCVDHVANWVDTIEQKL